MNLEQLTKVLDFLAKHVYASGVDVPFDYFNYEELIEHFVPFMGEVCPQVSKERLLGIINHIAYEKDRWTQFDYVSNHELLGEIYNLAQN